MFVQVISRNRRKKLLAAVGLTSAAGLLLAFPAAVATGINRGLSVCGCVIIPTLFPFMLLSGALTASPLCRQPGRLSVFLAGRLFGLPGCCGPAILISLVGGYPAGALAVSQLRRQELLTHEQALRMSRFCINAGPGFIISTVGSGLLGSTKAGLLLFAAHSAASLLIGIWQGHGRRQPVASPSVTLSAPSSASRLMEDAIHGLLLACGFVLAASTLLSLGDALAFSRFLQRLSGLPASLCSCIPAAVLEVSSGCLELIGSGFASPFWLCMCLSWSGLSVQGQVRAALKDDAPPLLSLWGNRLLHGVFSGLLAKGLFRLFPVTLSTGTAPNGLSTLPYTVSAAASWMLLLLTFLAMLYFSPKKTGNAEKDVV